MEYQNPILTGFYPDPSICRVGQDYYMVTSSFEYLPGIPVFHSRDLINWRQIGHCITRPEQMDFPGCRPSGGIFAATIRYFQGRFYVTSTNVSAESGGKNFIVSAVDPAGEWSNPIWIDQTGIDPSLLFDDDGTVYYTSNGEHTDQNGIRRNIIQQSIISIETGKILRGPEIISYGTGGRCAEGPHLYKKDGLYYLMIAEGGTELGHMETIFRSPDPFGPFEPFRDNPILTARDENRPYLCAAGHADIVEDTEGRFWMVFLCFRTVDAKFHHLGRETSIVPLSWEKGTWPQVLGGKAPAQYIYCYPEREVVQEFPQDSFYDDFCTGRRLDWNTLRKHFDGYSIGKNGLLLYGNEFSLSDQETPAFLGIRQRHMVFEAVCKMEFSPVLETEEAGLCLFYSMDAWYGLRITKKGKACVLSLFRHIHDMETESFCAELKEGSAVLAVRGDEEFYHFGLIRENEFQELAKADVRLLSTEVNRGFTGVYIGLYASGNGNHCQKPAVFQNFQYRAC